MKKPNTNAMVKQLGTSIRGGLDPDRDGHISIIDCRPYDPERQGFIHRVAKRGARKFLSKGMRHRAEKWIARKEAVSEAKVKAEQEEKLKYVKEAAKIKSEARLKRLKQRERGGTSVWGQFKGGFTAPRTKALISRRTVIAKPKYKYVKKGKHYVRKRVETPTPQKRESLSEYMENRFRGTL